jgi:hypothetical protein
VRKFQPLIAQPLCCRVLVAEERELAFAMDELRVDLVTGALVRGKCPAYFLQYLARFLEAPRQRERVDAVELHQRITVGDRRWQRGGVPKHRAAIS